MTFWQEVPPLEGDPPVVDGLLFTLPEGYTQDVAEDADVHPQQRAQQNETKHSKREAQRGLLAEAKSTQQERSAGGGLLRPLAPGPRDGEGLGPLRRGAPKPS